MRIVVISDIHANYEALKVLVPHFRSSDKILCLGDIIGYSCAVNECIDILREFECVCIQGNHDRYLIEGTDGQTKYLNESVLFGVRYAKAHITKNNLEWLKRLPLSVGIKEDSISMLMAHGSPFDPIDAYVYTNNTNFSEWKFNYDYIFLGHTHREMYVKVNNTIVFNPGSVGQSRDREGVACAAILDTETQDLIRVREPYDYMKNLRLSLSNGAGEYVFKHYQTLI